MKDPAKQRLEMEIRSIVEEENVDDDRLYDMSLVHAVERAILGFPADRVVEGSIPIQRLWRATQGETQMTLGQFKRWVREQSGVKHILLSKVPPAVLAKHRVPQATITQSSIDLGPRGKYVAVDYDAHVQRAKQRQQRPAGGSATIYPKRMSAEDIRRHEATARAPVGPGSIYPRSMSAEDIRQHEADARAPVGVGPAHIYPKRMKK